MNTECIERAKTCHDVKEYNPLKFWYSQMIHLDILPMSDANVNIEVYLIKNTETAETTETTNK